MTVDSVLQLVGNTPMLHSTKLQTHGHHLFLKLENHNPGGSIKDRIALTMIEQAEKMGQLKPGATIIEATAGNTGLGLALIATLKGYKIILVIPDKMSLEKMAHLKALGAEIRVTRSDVEKGHPEYYQDLAKSISEQIPNSFYINQFSNLANPLSHELSTGPEIWEQMNHQVDAIVCGVGSGGTLTGLTNYFAKVSPKTKFILADPQGSILTEYIKSKKLGTAGSWLVEGVGEDFIPDIADLSGVHSAYSISDKDSFFAARELLIKEGVFGGSSTGTILAAAFQYFLDLKKANSSPQRVVVLVPDSGSKYLSKMYNDYWMQDQGFISTSTFGDLRDLVSRPAVKSAVTSVKPADSLLVAFNRMRLYEYSQLPVLQENKIVGIIDEYDLLMAVQADGNNYKKSVSEFMTREIESIHPDTSIEKLWGLLRSGKVGVLNDHNNDFYGLITRTDALNHLRKLKTK